MNPCPQKPLAEAAALLGPGDYPFAARLAGQSEPLSLMCYLPPTPNVHYSACLMHCAEKLFTVRCRDFLQSFDHFDRLLLLPRQVLALQTNEPVFPIERTLVATGVNRAGD